MVTWKQKAGAKDFVSSEKAIFSQFYGNKTISEKYKIKGLDKAWELIKEFLDKRIRIVSDYDVDGTTSGAELMLGLNSLGAKDLKVRPPKRFSEGYGLSEKIVEELLQEDPGLLITVDNGISAIEQLKTMKDHGWKILIIDHHLPKTEDGKVILPPADVIIDPHAIEKSANFIDYCAAGLVYKLFQWLDQNPIEGYDPTILDKILSLAALGTVCDSVKLIETIEDNIAYDNYLIVKNGLFQMLQNGGRTTGLYCLLRALQKDYTVTETDLAYVIGPTMNAMSRLNDDGADLVTQLLMLDNADFNAADKIAQQLIGANNERKKIVDELLPVLKQRIKDAKEEDDFPLVVTGKPGEIPHGLIGLIAGNLAEEYNTITIVLSPNDEGELSGSGRAPEGTSLIDLLDQNKDLISNYGGHAQAAGLSIKAKDLDAFKKSLKNTAGDKPEELFYKYYQFELTPEQVRITLDQIETYAPYGVGHPFPVFKIINYELENRKGETYGLLGSERKVLKLFNEHADAIEFTGKAKEQVNLLGDPSFSLGGLTIFGTLSWNEWNGEKSPQIIINELDFPACESVDAPERASEEGKTTNVEYMSAVLTKIIG